jgi:hypothetical protein
MPRGLTLCVLFLGAALLSCDGPNRGPNTQPSSASGLFLNVFASPNVVRGKTAGSSGQAGGCALVQARVTNTQGELVSGVDVRFTTTLCCFAGPTAIDIRGITVTTLRGVANVTFCATDERGTATITAAADDAFNTVLITVF